MGNQFPNYLKNNGAKTSNNFSLEVFRIISFKSGYRFKMHSHKRIELNYILQGSCVMRLENELIKLNRNNSILVFPDSKHDFFVDSKSGIKIVQLEFQIDERIFVEFKDVLKSELSFLFNIKNTAKNYIKIPNTPEIGNCMERIIKENQLKRNNFQPLSKLYFIELIILLSRYINRQIIAEGNIENEYVSKAMKIIHANYWTGFSVSEIAKACNIPSRYLQKLFNKYLESTPQEYGNNLKIRKAIELLADRNIAVKEIAYSLGYSTPQYFSRLFKLKYGFSPQTYRKILFEDKL